MTRDGRAVRAVRWWLRVSGAVTFAVGLACLVGAAGWLPGLIVGIGLVVYGIEALTAEVGPGPARQ